MTHLFGAFIHILASFVVQVFTLPNQNVSDIG
jgi:hypothetical protein